MSVMTKIYLVIEYLPAHETQVVYAGLDKSKAEAVCLESLPERNIEVWVDGKNIKTYEPESR